MKSLKKIIRLLGLIALLFLATVGIGIAGVAPVPLSSKKENTIEIKVELVESDEDKTKLVQFDIKQ